MYLDKENLMIGFSRRGKRARK